MKKIAHQAVVAAGDSPLIIAATESIAAKKAEVKQTAAYKAAKQAVGKGEISKPDFVKKVIGLVQNQP